MTASLKEASGAFLDYLEKWQAGLQPLALNTLITEAGGPEHIGIFCVDVINGFCHVGPLSSERVKGIIAPIADLFTRARAAGIRHFVLPQDAHPPDAVEFLQYPPHCIRGTEEAATVPELSGLPFASEFVVLPKNSLHSALGTELDAWLDRHPEVTHQVVTGDCTDLCTYQLAMHLRLRANAANTPHQVVLPADCVDTYDLPVDFAVANNLRAHPAELLHTIFLYNMDCNGVRVVNRLS